MSNSYFHCNDVWYKEFEVFLPECTKKQINLLNAFVDIYHQDKVPLQYRIRKSKFDIYGQGITILRKIVLLMKNKYKMVLGSSYISGFPFCNFGEINQNSFKTLRTIESIKNNYLSKKQQYPFVKIKFCYSEKVFKDLMDLTEELKLKKEDVIFISVYLLCEIIGYGGPDCDFVSEIFQSDLRYKPDLDLWVESRKKMFNLKNYSIKKPNPNLHYGVIGGMPDNEVKFVEVKFDNIADDENKIKFKDKSKDVKPIKGTYYDGDNYYNFDNLTEFQQRLPINNTDIENFIKKRNSQIYREPYYG